MNTRYSPSGADWKVLKMVQFSIMSSEEIEKQSYVKIDKSDLFEKNIPKGNGLYDLRMGTIDKQYHCQTCNGDILNCQGHFGHIYLNEPIYNISFIKTVFKILQCICIRCSKLLTNEIVNYKQRSQYVFKLMLDHCKKVNECPHCQYVQPKWVLENYTIQYTGSSIESQKKQLSARNAFNILRKLSNECINKIGFNPLYSHPKDMIFINID